MLGCRIGLKANMSSSSVPGYPGAPTGVSLSPVTSTATSEVTIAPRHMVTDDSHERVDKRFFARQGLQRAGSGRIVRELSPCQGQRRSFTAHRVHADDLEDIDAVDIRVVGQQIGNINVIAESSSVNHRCCHTSIQSVL